MISHTVKGKGVSFMEGHYYWHTRALTPEEFATAMADLGEPVRGAERRRPMTLPMGRADARGLRRDRRDLADADPRIVMLDGDVGSSTRADIFEKAPPGPLPPDGHRRAEHARRGRGLATMGLIPFVSTFVAFAVVRPLDQIRVLIAQTGLNVKITPGYAGLFTGVTGKTHLIVDDVSIMRAMPGMVDRLPGRRRRGRARSCAGAPPTRARSTSGSSATRRSASSTTPTRSSSGKAVVVREGRDVTLISTGTQTPRVVDAAELLAAQGIEAHVLHVPTIKPLDVPAIVAAAERTGLVVTVEEHTVIGGLGGAVAETLSEHRPTIVKRLGLQDVFGESASNEALLEMYGLSAARVADQVRALLGSRTKEAIAQS